jgi:peptidoglycan hydrolase-like protein with peptidoglycan-binding domain
MLVSLGNQCERPPRGASGAAMKLSGLWVTSASGEDRFKILTIRSLQYLLNARGAKLTVDGKFGARTKAAVIAFQRAKALKATGVVTASTWLKLIVTVRQPAAGRAAPGDARTPAYRGVSGAAERS